MTRPKKVVKQIQPKPRSPTTKARRRVTIQNAEEVTNPKEEECGAQKDQEESILVKLNLMRKRLNLMTITNSNW